MSNGFYNVFMTTTSKRFRDVRGRIVQDLSEIVPRKRKFNKKLKRWKKDVMFIQHRCFKGRFDVMERNNFLFKSFLIFERVNRTLKRENEKLWQRRSTSLFAMTNLYLPFKFTFPSSLPFINEWDEGESGGQLEINWLQL